MAVGIDAIVTKSQRHVSIFAMVDLDLIALEQQPILFAGKIFAPETFFNAHDEICVLATLCPCERRRRVESNSFSAESDFARFQNDPKNHVAERRGQQCTNTGCQPRICLHQSWNNHAASDARDRSTDCHAIWNNEMLEIDKRSDDQEGNENPVRDRHLPREALPDPEEKQCAKQLHREIP